MGKGGRRGGNYLEGPEELMRYLSIFIRMREEDSEIKIVSSRGDDKIFKTWAGDPGPEREEIPISYFSGWSIGKDVHANLGN